MDLAGSKLRRKRSVMMLESASAPVSDFGRTQLERMGWTEGTGLGKRRDGITTHIKVKQRKEASGIGSEKVELQQQKDQDTWWMESVGNTLAKLGAKNAQRSVTDEEMFAATGGARFGMRAGKTRNLDKWKRVEDDIRDTVQRKIGTTPTTDEAVVHPNGKQKEIRKVDTEDLENVAVEDERPRKRSKKDKKIKKKFKKDKKCEKRG